MNAAGRGSPRPVRRRAGIGLSRSPAHRRADRACTPETVSSLQDP
ncbi:hypothetical protein BURPS668_0802 [Burkholderia pseudomallei 668]|nr:hypothetical protein BURPS668_0802 [Burkholderia pseudomallei 668]